MNILEVKHSTQFDIYFCVDISKHDFIEKIIFCSKYQFCEIDIFIHWMSWKRMFCWSNTYLAPALRENFFMA